MVKILDSDLSFASRMNCAYKLTRDEWPTDVPLMPNAQLHETEDWGWSLPFIGF